MQYKQTGIDMNLFKIGSIILSITVLNLIIFTGLFINYNLPGISEKTIIIFMGVGYIISLVYLSYKIIFKLWNLKDTRGDSRPTAIYKLLFLLTPLVLIWVFVSITVTDYYQAVTIYDEVIIALAASWVSAIFLFVMFTRICASLSHDLLNQLASFALLVLLGIPLVASLEWINTPSLNKDIDHSFDVFVGGEDNYKTYRIPSLLVIPEGSKLANGQTIHSDLLIAIAEARRDAALDTGVIDLVLKSSIDEGKTWSKQQIICQYEINGERGKCGNPTPVYDQQTGKIYLAHNLSGRNRKHTAVIITSDNGGKDWGERTVIAKDDLIFGPGHGIQKEMEPFANRLIIPGYLHRKPNSPNLAIVIYSDDQGATWIRSEPLTTGDESEVAELQDGTLYLTTRQHAAMGLAPKPNGRWWSISNDGGGTWSKAQKDLQLKTPVCQSSVLRMNDHGGLAFANPFDEKSRINMTIQYSPNNGQNWTNSTQIYMGPSGYSDLGKLTNNKTAVIYENGSMSYSEKISISVIKDNILVEN